MKLMVQVRLTCYLSVLCNIWVKLGSALWPYPWPKQSRTNTVHFPCFLSDGEVASFYFFILSVIVNEKLQVLIQHVKRQKPLLGYIQVLTQHVKRLS